jgi:hypothetical protein
MEGQLDVAKSCTEQLQSFHKPSKKYHGSPVKAQHIPMTRNSMKDIDDDPRPFKYRKMEGYRDYARNMIINYVAEEQKDPACRYLHKEADLKQAMHDHTYTKLPFVQHWIDDKLKVSKEEVHAIEAETREQSKSRRWHRERQWRLTASNFGTIIHATSRRNKKTLCETLAHPRQIRTKAIIHGHKYEKVALKKFEELEGVKVQQCGLFIDEDLPFLGASPDGIIDEFSLVEVKCPHRGREMKITARKEFKFLARNEEGELYLKQSHAYYDQIQGQLSITKRKICFFVVYTFKDLLVLRVPFNEKYCNSTLRPKLYGFYVSTFRPFIALSL